MKKIYCLVTIISIIISMVVVPTCAMTVSELSGRLQSLKSQYPNGTHQTKFYNSVYSGDGTACYRDLSGHSSWECMAWARKVYDTLWETSISNGQFHQNVSNIYIGDYVRFNAGGYDHSILITNIVGNTLYYTDCNASLDGKVQWDRNMQKSDLQTKVNKALNKSTSGKSYGHIVHYPNNNIKDLTGYTYLDIGDDFYAYIVSSGYDDLYVTNKASEILMKSYTGGNNQIWHFSRNADGTYKITNKSDKQCLDITGTAIGTGLCANASNSEKGQKWILTIENGKYIITSKATGYVADINGYGIDGNNLQLWKINSGANQQFDIRKVDEISGVDIGADFYATMMSPYFENLCVTNDNGNAIIQTYADYFSQIWHFVRNEDNSYNIQSVDDKRYLSVDGTSNGANVLLENDSTSDNQKWWLNGPIDGMTLTTKVSGYAMDINGTGNSGENLQLWKINSGANQQFAINKLSINRKISVEFDTDGGELESKAKAEYMYSSINGIRGEDQLVIFNNAGSTTGTNGTGVEVLVNENNLVTEVIERVGNATVPQGGFILSGHRVAQYWLIDNLNVGDYVKYDEDEQTVYVYDEKAYIATNKTVSFGENYGLLPTPIKKGYEFLGWTEDEVSKNIITSETMVSSTTDITLYAQWRELQPYIEINTENVDNEIKIKTKLNDVPSVCKLFFVGNNKVVVKTYENEEVEYTVDKKTNQVKIFAVESLSTLKPICEKKVLNQGEWCK